MIRKNLLHRLRLFWQVAVLVRRFDVLVEKAVTVKYVESIRIGCHCTLQSGVYLYGSRSGNTVTFGNYVAIGGGGMLLGEGGLTIGDFTHLGPRVVITTQYGDSGAERMQPHAALKYAPVKLGRGCWIGAGSVIMPGSNLGDGCIVTPNSVVFGMWRAGTVLSGNPARPKESGLAVGRPTINGQ
jgi:acetyltransferase-like isoleucine patch superfamily enzyme